MLLSWQYDRKPGVGALGIIYHGSRRAGGGVEVEGYQGCTVLPYMWSDPSDLSTYWQAWCSETTNKQEKNEARQ